MCNNHDNVYTIVITGIHACLQETLNTQILATIVETLESINSVTVGQGLKTTQYFPVGLGLACSNIEVPPVHDDRHIPVLYCLIPKLGTRLVDSRVFTVSSMVRQGLETHAINTVPSLHSSCAVYIPRVLDGNLSAWVALI